MNFKVKIDWKFVGALGASVVATIFASKMGPDAGERLSNRLIDAFTRRRNDHSDCDH